MDKLSIVVPCYNEEETVPLFYSAVQKVVDKMPVATEYWFVDDGSADQTLAELEKLHQLHPGQVHYLSFSRNFGKESALYAGLSAASGDYIVDMDADLQDPPSFLPQMYRLLKKGNWDCIGTRRIDRTGEAKFKSFLSNIFYQVINRLSTTKILPGVRDFRMMTRQMLTAVLSLKEYSRFSKGIFSWVGFRTKYLPYHNVARVAGKSDWTTWKLLKYAFNGIVDFSQVPLDIAMWMGGIAFVLSMVSLIVIIIRHWINPATAIGGWTSLVCIILLIGGLQLMCIGVIGRYISKIFLQVKNRPIYIIKKKA